MNDLWRTPPEVISTQRLLNETFFYDLSTGMLHYKDRPAHHFLSSHAMDVSNTKNSNRIVESIHRNGKGNSYFKFSINYLGKKRPYLAHRAIWLMNYGEWPKFVDHINGDGLDNRLSNLRNVSLAENNRNMRMMKTNTSGACGVYELKSGRFCAMIWSNNKQVNLGQFDTFNEALAARKGAEKILGYSERHGEAA